MNAYDAFQALRQAIAHEGQPPHSAAEPAFRRLALALADPAATAADRAVLLRQALRYWDGNGGHDEPAAIDVPLSRRWPGRDEWAAFGMAASAAGASLRVSAAAWRPAWLTGVGEEGVDGAAAAERQRRRVRPVDGDPFLAAFGRQTYQSAGQRAAMRAALATPPGGLLVVCLPTGEGKSFVFQAASRVGFPESNGGEGVTLVITPTVALALDHERACADVGLDDRPRAYQGGDPAGTNQQLAQRIEAGEQGLCFASPEAACGALRPALEAAAAKGFLRALVVDEAHIVDTWGANFRPEFHVFAGMRRSLLARAPTPFRTFLLSATLAEGALRALVQLFGGGPFTATAAANLRPEPEYWAVPPMEADERAARVREALRHVPRPAILYTTMVHDAESWYRVARSELGLGRVALVTGESDDVARLRAVDGWRKERLDLVVATSAFGLGIDYQHVRSVIHACVPESLDRFYQEVGRGGRDGRASLSLLLPTEGDFDVANDLNQKRLITPELGLQRWSSMFHGPKEQDPKHPDRFALQLNVAPGQDARRMDMVSKESVQWNVRTLSVMAGAGLLRLLGPESRKGSDGQFAPWMSVEVIEHNHLSRRLWDELVAPYRKREQLAARRNLAYLRSYAAGSNCISAYLRRLYDVEDGEEVPVRIEVAPSCGGCAVCRRRRREPWSERLAPSPHPWPPAPLRPGFVDRRRYGQPLLIVTYPGHGDPKGERLSLLAARLLADSGIVNVVAPAAGPIDPLLVQAELTRGDPRAFFFHGEEWLAASLTPGPELVAVSPGVEIDAALLRPGPGEFRLLLLPDDATDPSRVGRVRVTEVYDPHLGLEEAEEALCR